MTRLAIALALIGAFAISPAAVEAKGCPPGLAKKAVPCVPPGHAKHGQWDERDDDDHYRGGYYITDYDYKRLRYPERYGLPPLRPGERYYIANDQIYRVDSDTYKILNLIGAVSAFLN
ncbi:excinuclease ABC subunit A [Tabrizicola sp. J26]|uniref:excinuclease ABC subunit A n=1 Tax=Alitabrizicola rongguiensis TaxID=2909234 RepID=UPI001F3B45DE|nr:excinuclease ABC subunit A [Tabrizicola rongguiensis]MCF1710154.1 excinuclease ABC subunit A [Tabrizicola rongguiensis]